jgi:glycosyltransferase involved in cell wall biosynthesis
MEGGPTLQLLGHAKLDQTRHARNEGIASEWENPGQETPSGKVNASILFDARLVLNRPTGIGQYISSLVPQLLRQMPEWHFHILRGQDPWVGYNTEAWEASNSTVHISRQRHMSLSQQLALPSWAKRLGVDLLHYPHFDAPVIFRQVPVVATLHDLKYVARPEFFPELGRVKAAYIRIFMGLVARRASAIIAVSSSTAQDVNRLFGVPRDRLDVIPEAADKAFRPAEVNSVNEVTWKYNLNRSFILTVGERRPHKNHIMLIQAYSRSHARDSHDLVIVGRRHGSYGDPETMTHSLDLESAVHFIEDAAMKDLVALYTGTDLFVFPSLYEGFGLPLLEAMACGAPVVASRQTSLAEVAGDAAVLVDGNSEAQLRSAMERVLGDAALRRTLRERGFARAAQFSWDKAAEQTLAVYEKVLVHGPRR